MICTYCKKPIEGKGQGAVYCSPECRAATAPAWYSLSGKKLPRQGERDCWLVRSETKTCHTIWDVSGDRRDLVGVSTTREGVMEMLKRRARKP
jgi:hypothetical protein